MAGSLAGTVVDIRNTMPIDDATVTMQPGDHTTTTSNDGAYSMPLPAGTYELNITRSGYDPFTAEGIIVIDDVTTEIKAALHPSYD